METSTVLSDVDTSTDSQQTETTSISDVTTPKIGDVVVTLVTTPRSTQEDSTDTTEESNEVTDEEEDREDEEDEGKHEFDCTEMSADANSFTGPDQIPLECKLRPKGQEKPQTVFIVINKEGIDTNRLFNKNVKVVVKDLMVMDISPKKK